MCGRYLLDAVPADILRAFGVETPPELKPRYNIAPTQQVPIVRVNRFGDRELATVRWGLVPSWAKDVSIGNKLINARADTIREKPSFRTAYKRRRCLILATGFYEWRVARLGSAKQPMYIGMRDGSPFAFAGIWESWRAPDGDVVETCAIITTDANELVAPIHDRMPVIVAPASYDRWLDPAIADPGELLAPYPADLMMAYPVSTRVNNVRNEGPELIEPQPDE